MRASYFAHQSQQSLSLTTAPSPRVDLRVIISSKTTRAALHTQICPLGALLQAQTDSFNSHPPTNTSVIRNLPTTRSWRDFQHRCASVRARILQIHHCVRSMKTTDLSIAMPVMSPAIRNTTHPSPKGMNQPRNFLRPLNLATRKAVNSRLEA